MDLNLVSNKIQECDKVFRGGCIKDVTDKEQMRDAEETRIDKSRMDIQVHLAAIPFTRTAVVR